MARSTLNQISRTLVLANRMTRDVNAIKRGRYAQRVGNRIIGRAISNLMRRKWL